MSKLKNRLKSEWSKILENGKMRKVAQNYSKNLINFYIPRLLQCMQKICVKFYINKDFGLILNAKNAISVFNNNMSSRWGRVRNSTQNQSWNACWPQNSCIELDQSWASDQWHLFYRRLAKVLVYLRYLSPEWRSNIEFRKYTL